METNKALCNHNCRTVVPSIKICYEARHLCMSLICSDQKGTGPWQCSRKQLNEEPNLFMLRSVEEERLKVI